MKEFLLAVRDHLSPRLESTGFESSELAWRRFRNPYVDCVEIQIRSDQRACCVNLGLHLSFLPAAGTKTSIDPARLQLIDCEIRSRATRNGESDSWWEFKNDPSEVDCLVSCAMKNVELFFGKYRDFPQPFLDFEPSDLASEEMTALLPAMTKVRRTLFLARLHEHLGDHKRAKFWSQFGLEHAGMASGPKAEFREILNETRKRKPSSS